MPEQRQDASMNCSEAIREIPLYCYGEMTSATEERLESHISDCAPCTGELSRHRAFLETLSERDEFAGASDLAACRADLRLRIQSEAARPRNWFSQNRWLGHLSGLSAFHIPFRVPVGAMALVALGFFGARYTPESFGGVSASLGVPTFSSVRSVESGANGNVRVAVDEIHRHVVSGTLQDARIRDLLVSAVRGESNPSVRVDSAGMLGNQADSEPVRQALLDALTHDPNVAVRLKALEGLKPWAGEQSVRTALASVLLRDENPGVRVQAIDLLTAHHDDSIVGVLQSAVQKEDDPYVRKQCASLLASMKASVGTY